MRGFCCAVSLPLFRSSPSHTTNTLQGVKESLPAVLEHHLLQIDCLLQGLKVLLAALRNDNLGTQGIWEVRELLGCALNLAVEMLAHQTEDVVDANILCKALDECDIHVALIVLVVAFLRWSSFGWGCCRHCVMPEPGRAASG